jgi:uncharacterized protein (TIRG00374 family)
MVSPVPQSRRLRDRLLLAGLLAFVGFGLLGLAAGTGWDETLAQIAKLGPGQIAALLGLSVVNYVFRGFRWHLLARRLGFKTTILQDLRHFLGGFAISVTPGRVGELVRMRWLRRETGWPVDRTAPLVVMDRAADLATMALLLALGVGLGTGGIRYAGPVNGRANLDQRAAQNVATLKVA